MDGNNDNKGNFWSGFSNVLVALGGGSGIFSGIASIIGASNKTESYQYTNKNINFNPALALAIGGAVIVALLILKK